MARPIQSMAAWRRSSRSVMGNSLLCLLLLVSSLQLVTAGGIVAPVPTNTTIIVPTPTNSTIPSPAEEQERDSSLALFLVLFLLIFSFFVSYYLRVKRITAIHETIVGLFAGMLVGAVLRIGPGGEVQNMLSFSNTIMLNVLLPPIILASGYDLRQESFFRNFGSILAFAFAGTFISAIVIGVLVYLWSLADFTISLTLLECLIFGSTLSATDPVTILAIFNTKKVDPTLYSIIFGESLLNDAVSIVMFDTLSTFRGQSITIYSLFHGIGLFLIVFTSSMALGISFGLGCSLMLKHSRLNSYPQLESSLVALIAYTSYFFSNAVTMSGIVSLLFCGITLKHYAYHNMSKRTQRATRYTFQTLASLSENFIFIYLGLSLFTQEGLVFKPLFIVVTVAVVVVSRYAAVFPIAYVINSARRMRSRRPARRAGGGSVPRTGNEGELSREYQIMLFWAGLRGAVGFALSAGIEGKNAMALQTTVLVTIVLTLLVFGGTTSQMLDILGIRTGVQDDEGDSSDEEDGDGNLNLRNRKGYTTKAGPRRRAPGSSNGFYRDDDTHLFAKHTSTRSESAIRPPQSGGARYSYDDDESSQGSDILPSAASTSHPLGSGLSSPSESSYPEAFTGSSRATGGARALLEQGALIMRDGQWFQRIDDRYLKPYFSNAVASRKHEERKAQRSASRSMSVSGATTVDETNDGSGRNNDEITAIWEEEAATREPDAEVYPIGVGEQYEGGGDFLSLGGPSASGRTTPISRRGGNGELDNNHTRGNSSGVGGAFA